MGVNENKLPLRLHRYHYAGTLHASITLGARSSRRVEKTQIEAELVIIASSRYLADHALQDSKLPMLFKYEEEVQVLE